MYNADRRRWGDGNVKLQADLQAVADDLRALAGIKAHAALKPVAEDYPGAADADRSIPHPPPPPASSSGSEGVAAAAAAEQAAAEAALVAAEAQAKKAAMEPDQVRVVRGGGGGGGGLLSWSRQASRFVDVNIYRCKYKYVELSRWPGAVQSAGSFP